MATKDGYANDVRAALDAWDRLRAGFMVAEEAIIEIIAGRLWEPLGYDSFYAAWSDKMSDITLAKEISARVAYQMLSEGADAMNVALAVKGIGPETIKNIDRERKHDVPAGMARGASSRRRTIIDKPIHVAAHGREKASPDSIIHVEVGPTMMVEYTRIAKKLGRSVADIAKEAIEQKFRELA